MYTLPLTPSCEVCKRHVNRCDCDNTMRSSSISSDDSFCCFLPLCIRSRNDSHGNCCTAFCLCLLSFIILTVVGFVMAALIWHYNIITVLQGGPSSVGGITYESSTGGTTNPFPGCNDVEHYANGALYCADSLISSSSSTAGGVTPPTITSTTYVSAVLTDTPIVFLRMNEAPGTTACTNYAIAVNSYAEQWRFSYQGDTGAAPTLGQLPVLNAPGDTAAYLGGTATVWIDSTAGTSQDDRISSVLYTPTTVELWFRTTHTGPLVAFIRDCGSCSALDFYAYDPNYIVLYITDSGQVAINIGNMVAAGQGGDAKASNLAYNDGNNHHLVGVYIPATGFTLYIDGNAVTQYARTYQTSDSSFGADLGYWKVGDINLLPPASSYARYQGTIGEVAVYQTTITSTAYAGLSLNHIRAHYAAGGGTTSFNVISTPFTATSYNHAVVGDVPVFYWMMNEFGPLISNLDDAMGAYPGAFNYSVSNFTLNGGVEGITFTNASTGLNSPQQWPALPSALSFEVWIKPLVNSSTSMLAEFTGSLHSYITSLGVLGVKIDGNSNDTVTVLPLDGRWHQVVVTYSSSNVMMVYVDGVLGASQLGVVAPPAATGRWVVTAAVGNSVRRMSVYTYAMSAGQVANHYANG